MIFLCLIFIFFHFYIIILYRKTKVNNYNLVFLLFFNEYFFLSLNEISIVYYCNIYSHKLVRLSEVKSLSNLGQRKGKVGSVYTTPKSKRIAPPRYRNLDFA